MPGLRFSQSAEMAIHGLWSLASLETRRYVMLSEIARTQNVSESYLAKIFRQLTQAGLTHAVRGRRGGYALARAPQAITVGDVVRAVEDEHPMYRCLAQERGCEATKSCLLLRVFEAAERQMYAVLDGVSLADLMDDFLRDVDRMRWLQAHLQHTIRPPLPPSATTGSHAATQSTPPS
ncbi:HTH-type transcriptional repressor NsrR [Candidatus Entotheonellaceae bacterium PAL068K]